MTQRMILIQSPCYIPDQELKEAGSATEFFDRQAPLALEIGCGIGDFIVQRAAQEPETNFIALDIFNKGCDKTSRRVEKAGLENVRVARAEARYFLEHLVTPGTLEAVYINCPDPWPKKRHRKRRLVNRSFLEFVLYMLKPGGDIYFSTDFVDYGLDVAEELSTMEGFDAQIDESYVHHLEGYPLSKYMKRFLGEGKDIYFCHYRRNPDVMVPEPAMTTKGFRTPWLEDAANQ